MILCNFKYILGIILLKYLHIIPLVGLLRSIWPPFLTFTGQWDCYIYYLNLGSGTLHIE
jgi:hypothetical protein